MAGMFKSVFHVFSTHIFSTNRAFWACLQVLFEIFLKEKNRHSRAVRGNIFEAYQAARPAFVIDLHSLFYSWLFRAL